MTEPVRKSIIRVLIVDDSPTVRELLKYLFASDQEFEVVGTASNGEEAAAAVRNARPDVVTMDVHMPKMNGYAATRAIMESYPVPIVIVTDSSAEGEGASPYAALEAGAVAVVKRPPAIDHPGHAAVARELIQTVKLMAEVKVVRRWKLPKPESAKPAENAKVFVRPDEVRLVAIGSSTGGPLVLQQILAMLPKNFSLPIVIVQHITEGFAEGFCSWLQDATGFAVSVARQGEALQAGHAYVAPNGFHMGMSRQGRIVLTKGAPQNGHLPSVACLFRSVATAYGAKAIGILLTGMGKDGAAELGLMKQKGALTLVQDKESSVVYGMPGEAMVLGAADYALAPDKIGAMLINVSSQRAGAT